MIVEFTVVPLDKGPHLSKLIAPLLKIVAESGLDYQFTAMATIVEGEWDEVMSLIRRCHEEMLRTSQRVVTTIKISITPGAQGASGARLRQWKSTWAASCRPELSRRPIYTHGLNQPRNR